MKPVIEKKEFQLLLKLIHSQNDPGKNYEMSLLAEEIKRARIINADKMEPGIVRLHSSVKVEIKGENRLLDFTIVLPDEANLKTKKVSVLAPIAIAILGFKAGDEINWQLAGGKKRISILEVNTTETDLDLTA